MKRENILLYLTTNKLYLYFYNNKKELKEVIDTSSFFKCGEICNVRIATEKLSEFFNEKGLLKYIMKPNVFVLYNDITNSDLCYLYSQMLSFLSYYEIKFIKLTEIIDKLNKKDEIVLFDESYYTIFKDKTKIDNIEYVNFEPILIGTMSKKYKHYSDKDLIWNSLKSHFTNL